MAVDRAGGLRYHKQRWTVNLGPATPVGVADQDEEEARTRFHARHSAHAEPVAIWKNIWSFAWRAES